MESASVTSFFQTLGRPVAYYPIFASKLGGVTPAVMFCQLSYWHRNGAVKEGEWFYKSTKEMFEETGLTRWEQETARKRLEERKVIATAVKGVPATMHYRIDWPAFEALWDKPVCGDTANQFEGKPQTGSRDSRKLSMQESTGETTTKTDVATAPSKIDASPYSGLFEGFWGTYPRKADKKKAYRCWLATQRRGAHPVQLQNAAMNYAAACRKDGRDEKFVKLAATFLGPDEPWKEYVGSPEKKRETLRCPNGHIYVAEVGMCLECGWEMKHAG